MVLFLLAVGAADRVVERDETLLGRPALVDRGPQASCWANSSIRVSFSTSKIVPIAISTARRAISGSGISAAIGSSTTLSFAMSLCSRKAPS
jgi:hypothetical protein